ncbi:hypothetical protein SEA_GODPHATHER_60 [Mycobacterium phage GodPhather]|uniref:Uncharacterized protein n=1 Tax=Mycobacterium phage Taptic TaxID=1920305 RepID=A0A1J0MDW3_9CAUD|nr:hypothetical protein PQB71_gp59 [Mycobacterium phage Taptic]APD19289.1 hypothetical protein SEA_TAPTIC_59 [Mycobacterium phage Taptic]QBP32633.1 hypothetical protein SEA_GODPHATHER_60 [Mycobacterium phage GodPhather]QBP32723.1 hypothetical protein SEA_CEPENS_59 [Mycobacterium phage Cepens]
MDIYVVLDGARVVGASTRLQGAELIRSDEAKRLVTARDAETLSRRGTMHGWGLWTDADKERWFYDQMQIVNTELQDME